MHDIFYEDVVGILVMSQEFHYEYNLDFPDIFGRDNIFYVTQIFQTSCLATRSLRPLFRYGRLLEWGQWFKIYIPSTELASIKS